MIVQEEDIIPIFIHHANHVVQEGIKIKMIIALRHANHVAKESIRIKMGKQVVKGVEVVIITIRILVAPVRLAVLESTKLLIRNAIAAPLGDMHLVMAEPLVLNALQDITKIKTVLPVARIVLQVNTHHRSPKAVVNGAIMECIKVKADKALASAAQPGSTMIKIPT